MKGDVSPIVNVSKCVMIIMKVRLYVYENNCMLFDKRRYIIVNNILAATKRSKDNGYTHDARLVGKHLIIYEYFLYKN